MSNKSEQYVSSLLGAIDTVVSERLKQIAYDKTIICTITDNSEAKNGIYQVSDGSVKFQAQCENTTYRIDDQVRVQVPNGDMTEEKFILGKYTKDIAMTPITYLSPVDSILKISGNLITSNKDTVYALAANGEKDKILIWDSNLLGRDSQVLQNSQVYDTIYIEAEFKSLLSSYNIKQGNYGLVLELYPQTPDGFAGAPIKCVLDCSNMMGNPYAFSLYTKQAATFDISNVTMLHSIKLYFVQDGNFQTIGGTTLQPTKIDGVDVSNLFLQNIELGFGSQVQNVADNTVKIFTADSMIYDRDRETMLPIDNEKTLNLIWYNKDEHGKYIGWNDRNITSPGLGWADEATYVSAGAYNAKLAAMVDYNIPMEAAGLEVAANLPALVTAVKNLSKFLSKDVYQVLFSSQNNLSQRFPSNDAKINNFLQTLNEKLSRQTVSITVNNNTEIYTINELATEFQILATDILNEAAVEYNLPYIPETLNDWSFKWDDSKTTDWTKCAAIGLTLQQWITETMYYLYEYNDTNGVFLTNTILRQIDDYYPGYKGVYNEFERRFASIQQELIALKNKALNLFNVYDQGISRDIFAVLKEYADTTRNFVYWTPPKENQNNVNQYCIYWYRAASQALGDEFMPAGWERIEFGENDPKNYKSESISVLLDARYTTTESFQALVFFNHACYKSNVLTFTNNAPIMSDELANLSDTIRIFHGKNSKDVYPNYNIANMLVDGSDRFIPRILNVEYIYENGGVNNDYLNQADIYWYVPKTATMISIEEEDLNALNSLNPFKTFSTGAYYREGYDCFYKTINYKQNTESNIALDSQFAYRIKEYYSATATNNTIICKVVRDGASYETDISLSFMSKGANGTGYTIAITSMGDQAALTPDNVSNAWNLKIELYDNNNELITYKLEQSQITTSLVMPSKKVVLGNLECYNSYCILPVHYNPSNQGVANCNILRVDIQQVQHNNALIDIATFFPIPFASQKELFIEGASYVIYDSSGGNPSYSKYPYALYHKSQDEAVKAMSWDIEYDPGPPGNASSVRAFLPTLDGAKNILKPSPLWIQDGDVEYHNLRAIQYYPYVVALHDEHAYFWEQPLVLMQNRFSSPLLNDWDGKFKIDEENGTILSTMVGAGYKHTDNSFYGVLMGDIGPGTKSAGGVGLYGYHAGAQSFGFNIDGKAFLGKSGQGRIILDGTNSTISDAAQNLVIDLNKGHMIGKRFTLSGGDPENGPGFRLTTQENEDTSIFDNNKNADVQAEKYGYFFLVKGKKGEGQIEAPNLMKVSSDGVYMQSESGDVVLSLISGNSYLNASKFKFTAGNTITLNSHPELDTDPYFNVRDVNSNELLTITQQGVVLQDPEKKIVLTLKSDESSLNATGNFSLTTGTASKDNSIVLTSDPNATPFSIGSKFAVDWSGRVSLNNDSVIIDPTSGITITQGSINIANNFVVTDTGIVTIKNGAVNIYEGSINLGKIPDDPSLYYFTVTDKGQMSLLHNDSEIRLGWSTINAGDYAVRISKDGIEMHKGKIELGYVASDSNVPGSAPYYQFTLTDTGKMTLLHPDSVISLGLSKRNAGDPAVKLSSSGLEMHEGSIKLGYDSDRDNYNTIIDETQIRLGLDPNSQTGGHQTHYFSVTSEGQMVLYHPESIIEIAQANSEAGTPAVQISKLGVKIYSGDINLGYDSNSKAYNFSVANDGKVTIKYGSINLGYNSNSKKYNFSVTDQGVVTIQTGSIDLGTGAIHLYDNGNAEFAKQNIVFYNNGSAEFKGTVAIGASISSSSIPVFIADSAVYFNATSISDMSTVNTWSAKIGADGLEIKQGTIYLDSYTTGWGSNYQIELDKDGIRCGSCLVGESEEDLSHNFIVDSNGNVSMRGALNIADIITMDATNGFQMNLSGSNGNTPTEFSINKTGLLTASNAIFKGTLTVKNYDKNNPAHLYVNGTTHITGKVGLMTLPPDDKSTYDIILGGNTYCTGNLYMSPGSAGNIYSANNQSNYISFSDGLWVYGSKLRLYSEDIMLGNNGAENFMSKVLIKGDTTIQGTTTSTGTFTFKGDIYSGTEKGKTDTYQVKTKAFESNILHFVHGLLVKVTNKKGEEVSGGGTEGSESDLPTWSTSDSGRILTVTANGSIAWRSPAYTLWEVGTSATPVYFEGGVPKKCNYSFSDYYTKDDVYTKTTVNALYNSNSNRIGDLEEWVNNHSHNNFATMSNIANLEDSISSLNSTIDLLQEQISNIKSCTCTPNPTN